LIFRGRSCKSDDTTVLYNKTELYSSQDAVSLGHHLSVANKYSLVADVSTKFSRGCNMFFASFSLFRQM